MCQSAKSPLTSEKTVQGGAVTRAVRRIRSHSLHAHPGNTRSCAHMHTFTHTFGHAKILQLHLFREGEEKQKQKQNKTRLINVLRIQFLYIKFTQNYRCGSV